MQPVEHKATRRHGDAIPVMFSTRERPGPKAYAGYCKEHGGHTHLDVDPTEFTVEKDGVEWELDREYSISYCQTCLDERYYRTPEWHGSNVDEVVRQVVRDHWDSVRRGFDPTYLAKAGEVSHCPFCGEPLGSTESRTEFPEDDDATHGTCPEHGPLSLRITQERDPQKLEA